MKPALLLIDLQQDFLATADLQPAGLFLVSRAEALLQSCRARQFPVIHVWTTVDRETDRRMQHWRKLNRWMCVAGTPGHKPPESLRPLSGEMVVHKTGFNPFASGELDKVLRARGCDSVVLAGVHLHACVRTAAIESFERDFRVFIAEDATGSNDPIHAAATRRWLSERCIIFQPVRTVLECLETGAPGKWIHHSPRRTEEILFELKNADPAEVSATAAAAKAAWTPWRHTPISERQQILDTVAKRLEAATSELARQIATDIGKPVRHAEEEIRRAAANIRDVIRRAPNLSAPKRETAGLVRCEPVGTVGIITAWNNPAAIPLGKIAPALVYGNTVVWKPAPAATRIADTVLRLFRESGLPPAILGMTPGDHATAQLIAADKNVDAITLTGALVAGQAIQEICARRIIPLQAELSGNNAAIIWDDADLAATAAQIAWGAFAFAGQRCTANRRAIIHAPRLEPFLRELEAATARLPWGDPFNSQTEIGPVIHSGRRDELELLTADAETTGAAHRVIRPCSGPASEAWVKTGAYAQPVIAGCDQPRHALVQEETMSPLLVVQRADDFEHALALCNGVRHGLIASIFSGDAELQKQFFAEARAGILKLNSSTAGVDVMLPFGGWKASGLGPPEHGEGDVQCYTRMQAVYGLSI